tara:strand:- start:7653 stop:7895 length:243 start_codon:yes stop_codon:yes gene_type:complete
MRYIKLHAMLIPFLFLHWLTNNDTCALTEIEKWITNTSDNEGTFIGSIVSPIFLISSNDIKVIALFFWIFSLSQVLHSYK